MLIRKFSWLGFFRMVPIMIGLVSGCLGIAQQLILLYSDNPSPVWQRQVFWSIVWIAFVLSAIAAWVMEHQKVAALTKEIEKSLLANFVPKILDVRVNTIDWYGEAKTIVTIFAEVRNLGAASIVADWRLWILLPSDELLGDFVPAYIESGGLFVEGEGHSLLYPMTDSLLQKGAVPIETGDRIRGYLSFALPHPREKVDVLGAIIRLYPTDIRDRGFNAVLNTEQPQKPEPRFFSGTNPEFLRAMPKARVIGMPVESPKKRRRKNR